MVDLKDFFASSRLGLETNVGEKGVLLSGGQRQRIGIARALFSNPQLIIMDEATSALDVQTERLINDLILEENSAKVVITVVHKVSTLLNFKKILYLEKGEIVATGSFEELRVLVPDFEKQIQLSEIV
jgi:ABC-type multidrug transport system fused ATPase/permease subunit